MNRKTFNRLLEDIDRSTPAQKIEILMRLHENPPEGIDPVKEALAVFDSLNEIETFQFLQEIKTRMTEPDIKLMLDFE